MSQLFRNHTTWRKNMSESKDKYYNLVDKFEEAGLGEFVDTCVDAENSMHLEFDSEYYWFMMYINLIDSVRMRTEEIGINIKDYGFNF